MEEDVVDVLLASTGHLRHHAASVWDELGLTAPLALALRQLHRGPRSQRELAASLGYDPSNITGLADKLEERGLVERHVDPDDRRVKKLVLSPAGQALLELMQLKMHAVHPIITNLTKSEQDQLIRLLRKATAGATAPSRSVAER